MAELEPLAALRGIAKRCGAVQALAGVDLDIYTGRIHAICRENGAGKSMLMRVIAGRLEEVFAFCDWIVALRLYD
jgi:ABC-type sugar transport system ATPase subunit